MTEPAPGEVLEAARTALERAVLEEPLVAAERSYLSATASRLAAMVAGVQGRDARPTPPKVDPDADPPKRPRRLLNRKEAARLAGVHPNSLLNWEAKGLLTPRRDWRGWRVYDRDDLARAMAMAAHLPLADLPESATDDRRRRG